MSNEEIAFGKPGIAPTWCSSSKDLVTTSLGMSRTWATIGHGILNEVFWPSTGRPQIRDLGFIVSKGDQWWELKRLDSYELSTPRPYVLLPTIRHSSNDFSLTLEIVCDDLRDVVLICFNLEGDDCKLFSLLAPRLGSKGRENTAWCEQGGFYAQHDDNALCLHAGVGFTRQSAGYVGRSDGWQDFESNGAMTWEFARAETGNVAVMGELAENQGVLALGFGTFPRAADTLTRGSLADGFNCVRQRVNDRWEEWGTNWKIPVDFSDEMHSQVEHCTAVIKTCDDRLFPGAVVASLSVPWGNHRDDRGGYHLVWARDSVEAGLGMISVGHYAEARLLLSYLIATQQDDGHWTQNFFPSGAPYWKGIQLDETSFPLLLVAKLLELEGLGELEGVEQMVRRALGFLLRAGPVTPQDRWEENRGISPFTLSMIIAAIVGTHSLVEDASQRDYLLSYADYLNRRIEDWLFVAGTDLARKYDVDGYYIRLAMEDIFSGSHGEIALANGGGTHPVGSIVGLDFLYLTRLGLRSPDDPRILDSLKVAEGELRVETPKGPSFYRYQNDGYGEHEDGSPFDGRGKGRLWPLLTGERGHFAVQRGEDASEYLEAMAQMSGPGGLIPEQIWDTEPIPQRGLSPGKPSGSAMPLLWAHAELVKLAVATVAGQAIELLKTVRERYDFTRPEPHTWHWRTDAPFGELPIETDLLIESPQAFQLHFGFDGWQNVMERDSMELGFGMYGVRLAAEKVQSFDQFNFTLRYSENGDWEHVDHTIEILSNKKPTYSRHA